jgi:vancomycin resistance protein VanW
VHERIKEDSPRKKALSSQYPKLLPFILGMRRFVNNFKNSLNSNLSRKRSEVFFTAVIARHSSPLFRKLGDSDPNLHNGKIKNLTTAIQSLNGVIIPPGKSFSFWNIVGATTTRRGFTKGMLISNGKVVEGLGGGLCQLSNLLYWLFLHTPVEIVERKHHSRDVFPDSGRTIPFGSGATIFHNLIDLRIKNTSLQPIQLKLWLAENQLKGQILSTQHIEEKYHLKEKNHYFVKTPQGVYRYNEIWREIYVGDHLIREEKVVTNCALVMYEPESIDLHL